MTPPSQQTRVLIILIFGLLIAGVARWKLTNTAPKPEMRRLENEAANQPTSAPAKPAPIESLPAHSRRPSADAPNEGSPPAVSPTVTAETPTRTPLDERREFLQQKEKTLWQGMPMAQVLEQLGEPCAVHAGMRRPLPNRGDSQEFDNSPQPQWRLLPPYAYRTEIAWNQGGAIPFSQLNFSTQSVALVYALHPPMERHVHEYFTWKTHYEPSSLKLIFDDRQMLKEWRERFTVP